MFQTSNQLKFHGVHRSFDLSNSFHSFISFHFPIVSQCLIDFHRFSQPEFETILPTAMAVTSWHPGALTHGDGLLEEDQGQLLMGQGQGPNPWKNSGGNHRKMFF